MDVLLTNDDGIRARGLRALYAALLEAGHTVHVVAPMSQQSGVGHSLTVFEPVRAMEFEELDFKGLGIYGTPTDCVKLALGQLLAQGQFDAVSGCAVNTKALEIGLFKFHGPYRLEYGQ